MPGSGDCYSLPARPHMGYGQVNLEHHLALCARAVMVLGIQGTFGTSYKDMALVACFLS